MSDLIRRDDATKAFDTYINGIQARRKHTTKGEIAIYLDLKGVVESLPTAEPLVTVEAKQNEGLYLNTDEETLLETEYIVVATDGMYKEYIHETDGKPKVGKWTNLLMNDGWTCSVCGYDSPSRLYNYCPNCGAKMKRSE